MWSFGNMIRLLVVTFVLWIKPCHTFFDTFMYPCSSAMVCVDISKCDKIGVMSKNDVILNEFEELFRSPLLPCRKTDGDQGVCCRDPDYKDDWPTDVKFYDQKGQWNPKPTTPKIIGSDSKTTEIKACTPPAVRLPNGKCGSVEVVTSGSSFASGEIVKPSTVTYLPPKSGSDLKETAECSPNEVRLPNGQCGPKTTITTKPPLTYLPPVTPVPCPPGTEKTLDGKCQQIVKIVSSTTTTTEPPLTYIPPVSPSTCPPGTQKGPDGKCQKIIKVLPSTTPTSVTPVSCPPGTEKTNDGKCQQIVKILSTTTEPPLTYIPPVSPSTCPPGTQKGPDGNCQTIVKQLPITTTTTTTVKPTLPYVPDRTYLPPLPSSKLKPVDANTISSIPPKQTENKCPYGTIIEQNNRRYCCELIS